MTSTEIPDGWKEILLSQICELQRGFDITKETCVAGDIPVYSSSGISYFHNKPKVTETSIVTGRKGLLGRVFLVTAPFWPHDTTLWGSNFLGNNPHFSAYKLQSFGLEKLDAATSVPTLNRNNLREHVVIIPSNIAEQEAIASALSDADALIESLEQLLAKKRQIKQGAMQELLTGDWPSKAFGDLFKFSGGYSASRNDLGSNGHLYLHYGDIHGSDLTFVDVESHGADIPRIDIPLSEVSPTSLLEHGDVVFVDASEDVDGTNKHVVIDNPRGQPFISGLHTIVAKRKTNELDPRYMRYCFQTPKIKEQFRFYAVGTKVSGVSKTSIAKIVLPVPSPNDQSEIAATLDAMERETELIGERLAKARQLKQAMMQQLLTGRIRLV